jgi:hypothetical protein
MVVLVNGLRGPQLRCRRYAVIPDLASPAYTLTTVLPEATFLQPEVAREWCTRYGYWPQLFRNWTVGYAPPPECPPPPM